MVFKVEDATDWNLLEDFFKGNNRLRNLKDFGQVHYKKKRKEK